MLPFFLAMMLWAVSKSISDPAMWKAVYWHDTEALQRYWHSADMLKVISTGLAGWCLHIYHISHSLLYTSYLFFGSLLLANVMFRILYVKRMYNTCDITDPEVNKTVLFWFWKKRDVALRLEHRSSAILFYGTQIIIGLALISLTA